MKLVKSNFCQIAFVWNKEKFSLTKKYFVKSTRFIDNVAMKTFALLSSKKGH